MREEIAAVKEFHQLIDADHIQPIAGMDLNMSLKLKGEELIKWSSLMEQYVGSEDKRVLRGHIMCEEFGELLVAIAEGDEVKAADALADTVYVLIGSAITMDLPLHDLFWEVHRSNMTKKRAEDDPGRCRDKGASYVPPDIEAVIKNHRKG